MNPTQEAKLYRGLAAKIDAQIALLREEVHALTAKADRIDARVKREKAKARVAKAPATPIAKKRGRKARPELGESAKTGGPARLAKPANGLALGGLRID